ncbi:MAG: branched-chain amino acid ABC transporter permease [Erysipelotrichaceae bacterium]|nr:branched-chain amino acid ABC transporter permease [Erysipelotrichaceae bacterium]
MKKITEMLKKVFSKKYRQRTVSYLIVVLAYLIIETAIKTGSISNTIKSLLVPTCSYIVAALALNLLIGYLGDLCLGQAGFMAVGAFFGAVASVFFSRFISGDVPVLILAIIVGGIAAGLCGALIGIPVLKLQGDYLAIVTLAFCQIIKTLLLNLYVGIDSKGLHFSFITDNTNMDPDGILVIKGAIGANVTKKLSSFTAGILLILFALFIIHNLINSKHGRAIQACRDNKIAASSVGISVSRYKLLVFVISAVLTGMAGTLYGLGFSSFKASKFDFNLSILILVYVVLGGLGNMTGTIISTTLLLVIPEALRAFNDYRMIIYSIVLIAVMLISNNAMIMYYLKQFKDHLKKMFPKRRTE